MNQTEDPLKRLYEAPNFKPFMKKMALISGVASIIGLLLKISGTPGARSLLIMGMSSLSMISFMAGHLFPCPENAHNMKGIWNFVMTYTGYTVSVGILGISGEEDGTSPAAESVGRLFTPSFPSASFSDGSVELSVSAVIFTL